MINKLEFYLRPAVFIVLFGVLLGLSAPPAIFRNPAPSPGAIGPDGRRAD